MTGRDVPQPIFIINNMSAIRKEDSGVGPSLLRDVAVDCM
jgi:hypothetical protein